MRFTGRASSPEMADFKTVPVVDVHMDNFSEMWPTIMLALKTSTFAALDAEMSGLGDRRKLNVSSVEDRYSAMAEVAKTRSVVSLGLSCFRLDQENEPIVETDSAQPDTNSSFGDQACGEMPSQEAKSSKLSKKLTFVAQTFNILLLCSESYTVDPDSLRFLVGHGFDFNKQYAEGIPYYRGNDYEEKGDEQARPSIRGLFTTMIQMEVPVVLHNALIDLVFLYQSFHATLPSGLGVFLADMAELFSGGTYDTKYIAEFEARMPASYLQYVFRKCQRENCARAEQHNPFVSMTFLTYPEECSSVNYLPCRICEKPLGEVKQICVSFAAHGWCKASTRCSMSHDIDLILDNENFLVPIKKRRRVRKRHRQKQSNAPENDSSSGDAAMDNVMGEKMEVDSKAADFEDSQCGEERGSFGLQEGDQVMSAEIMEAGEELAVTGENVENQLLPEKHGLKDLYEETGCDKSRKLKSAVVNSDSQCEQNGRTAESTGCHRAGFDAFMTGFIFACFIVQYGRFRILPPGAKLSDLGMQDYSNKITLTGKDIPLQIVKSNFVKTSKNHKTKINKIRNQKV